MEFKKYLKIISQNKWLLILIILISVLSTYFFSINKKVSYTGSLYANAIVNSEETTTIYYDYDNYYSLKASESYLDIVSSWLKDPASVTSIYNKANEILPETTISKYSKTITTKKVDPTTIQITVKSETIDKTKNVLSAIKNFITDKSHEYNQKGYIKNAVIVTGEIFIAKDITNININLLISGFISLILGLMFIFFINYFKEK